MISEALWRSLPLATFGLATPVLFYQAGGALGDRRLGSFGAMYLCCLAGAFVPAGTPFPLTEIPDLPPLARLGLWATAWLVGAAHASFMAPRVHARARSRGLVPAADTAP